MERIDCHSLARRLRSGARLCTETRLLLMPLIPGDARLIDYRSFLAPRLAQEKADIDATERRVQGRHFQAVFIGSPQHARREPNAA